MISIAFDNLSRKQLVFWSMVFLSMIAFFSIGVASYIKSIGKYNGESITESLSEGLYNSGVVSAVELSQDATSDEVNNFKTQLLQLDEIEYIGNYWYAIGTGDYLAPIAEIENEFERIKGSEVADNETEYLNMDYSLIGFSELKVASGYSLSEIERLFDDNTRIIYLGANLADIPVGTVFELKLPDGTVARREYVAGILEKASYWPAEGITSEGNFLPIYEKVCLDNIYVVLNNTYSVGFPWFYSPSDGYSLQEAQSAIVEKAKENNIGISTEILSDVLSRKNEENQAIINYAAGMFVVVILTTSIIVTCTHLSSLVLRSREFGVLYACGYTKQNMMVILFIENLVHLLLALILSVLGMVSVVNSIAKTYTEVAGRIYLKLFWSDTFPVLVLVMLCMLILGTIVPIVILLRRKPVEFLENRF